MAVLDQVATLVKAKGLTPQAKKVNQLELERIRDLEIDNSNSFEKASESVLIKDIITAAIDLKASDIHLFAWREQARICFRSYGILGQPSRVSHALSERICRLIGSKCNAQFSPNEPYDGRFSITIEQRSFTVRVNSEPSPRGPKIVMRLFDPQALIPFDKLGYYAVQEQQILETHEAPEGLFLASGPTNSGKTMVIHALLARVPEEYAILTMEDPVEYMLPNAHHTPMTVDRLSRQEEMDYTQGVIRGTVRQDPDLLFMGEIRDQLSADLVLSASLQGKRVYATIHTGSLEDAKERLVDTGIPEKAFKRPSFLRCIVNQLLAPKLCEYCKLDDLADRDTGYFKEIFNNRARYRNKKGCRYCNSGYRGRLLIAEVMPVDENNFHLLRDADYIAMKAYLREQGIYRKEDVAIDKVMQATLDPFRSGIVKKYTGKMVEKCLISIP